MKNYILALLTSLFLSAMPLEAAYSQGAAEPEQCSVATLSSAINDEAYAEIEKDGGQMFGFATPETLVPILNLLTEDMGSPPPFEFDAIYISHPTDEAFNVNILFAKGSCAVNFLRRPYLKYASLFKKT